jgi:nucleoside-diphosphate-sugar epimerase
MPDGSKRDNRHEGYPIDPAADCIEDFRLNGHVSVPKAPDERLLFMNVVITGATDLIGSSICARLIEEGHIVVAVVRPGGGVAPFGVRETVHFDVSAAVETCDWTALLRGVDAVVNCVGALQESQREDVAGVHVAGPAALFQACDQVGVKRVIHFSAIGIIESSRLNSPKRSCAAIIYSRPGTLTGSSRGRRWCSKTLSAAEPTTPTMPR